MGLHLCYELACPLTVSDAEVAERFAQLRQLALALPLHEVSPLVHLTETELAGPFPLRGLHFERLEDVVHVSALSVREGLHRRALGIDLDDYRRVDVPVGLSTTVIGFAVAPGQGCEPASFGLARLNGNAGDPGGWWWHVCCKTQYASIVSTEHLITCHRSLVEILDAAPALGIGIEVRDETGYWMSRDADQLVEAVAEMNRIVARIAGTFNDAARSAGVDSRQVGGAIFQHPDFERLESSE